MEQSRNAVGEAQPAGTPYACRSGPSVIVAGHLDERARPDHPALVCSARPEDFKAFAMARFHGGKNATTPVAETYRAPVSCQPVQGEERTRCMGEIEKAIGLARMAAAQGLENSVASALRHRPAGALAAPYRRSPRRCQEQQAHDTDRMTASIESACIGSARSCHASDAWPVIHPARLAGRVHSSSTAAV